MIANGGDGGVSTDDGPAKWLEGEARKQEILGHPTIQHGDWRRGYSHLEVLKQVELGDKKRKAILIRASPDGLPGKTIVVSADSGLVGAEKLLQFVPGSGYIGLRTIYGDFHDVAGMKLPFHIEATYASPFLGKMVIQYESSETGVDEADLFSFPQ